MKYTEIKIHKVKVLKPYSVEVSFNDGKVKKINLEPVLHGSVFGPLRNPELFREVKINKEVHTIEWPNGADFHPETLYNWDDYKDEMAKKAEKWQHKKTA